MAEEETEEGGGKKSKKLIVIVLILLLLIGVGVGGFFLWSRLMQEETPAKTEATAEEFPEEEDRTKITNAQEKADVPDYFFFRDPKEKDGGEYIVNLMDGRHFLTVKLVAEIELGEVEVREYLNARRPLLDDMIITRLAMLDSEAARDPRTH